jgi:hypothetical protein
MIPPPLTAEDATRSLYTGPGISSSEDDRHHGYQSPDLPTKLESDVKVKIKERPESRDHRSFAATTFGTAAFKMLEWLTSQGVDDILSRINDLGIGNSPAQSNAPFIAQRQANKAQSPSLNGQSMQPHHRTTSEAIDDDQNPGSTKQPTDSSETSANQQQITQQLQDGYKHHKSGSKTTVRAAPSKSSRRTSLESSPMTPTVETRPNRRSHRSNGFHYDKLPRPPKSANTLMSRGLPDIPSRPTLFENVPTPLLSLTRKPETSPQLPDEQDSNNAPVKSMDMEISSAARKASLDPNISSFDTSSLPLKDYPPPQTLSQLNIEIVEFISHVFEEDQSSDDTLFCATEARLCPPDPKNHTKKLVRKKQRTRSAALVKRWKAFNEQVIFSVLSDSRSLLSSFTKEGKIYDSQSLWYCMLRLMRVTPTLVLHSLWLAAESLFIPPKSLSALRPVSWGTLRSNQSSLSDSEAGFLISICLHGLMAAASLATDSRTLYEMSRIRSNGLALAENGAPARQPSSVCLEYDDVFSNEVALRLARRLFRAVTARRCFAEMSDLCASSFETAPSLDILRPLLSQLDLLSPDSVRMLEFSSEERLLHETRAPTLLLDWARAVLLADWDGKPEFSTDGPFSGALSFIAAMRKWPISID